MTFVEPATVTAAAEAAMTSTCTITAPGTRSFNASTHAIDEAGADVIYAGACSLLRPKMVRRSGAGGDDRTVEARILRLPLAATGVTRGHRVTVAGFDLDLVVDEVLGGTASVERRVRCVASSDAPGVPS